tara:strand:- start:244 stop:438 length:195 start_codon:yes stop_codon:yes gene_type:complete
MDNWEQNSNNEIRHAQINMHQEYEAIKLEIATLATKINSLTKRLDEIDITYAESKKVIDNRLKY